MRLFPKYLQQVSQDILSSAVEGHKMLGLWFRDNSARITLDNSQEIGVLDCAMAAALKTLKERAPVVTVELSVDYGEDRDSCARHEMKATSTHPLRIGIYGPNEYFRTVGSTLSSTGMYLQEPVRLDHSVLYRNPHFISWDDDSKTPLLARARVDPNTDLAIEIEAILESPLDPMSSPSDVKQDPRISTTLRRYDSRWTLSQVKNEY